MSRLKNFTRGVLSGYVQMAANIVFTLVSVPLALHYLSKEQFALWALVTQIAGYFALIDLGMGSAVSRILADYKDDRNGGRYGGVLKAGGIVFCAQGLMIAAATWICAPALSSAFGIGPEWRGDFVFLLRGYGLLMAFVFGLKVWTCPFWGFQRYDVGNYAATVGFGVQMGVLWSGFAAGLGIKSMLLAFVAQSFLTTAWTVIAGWKLGFYPSREGWGKIERGVLREMFTFGRDVFLMALGGQLLSASQIMLITRLLGLDAAATWAICSKLFTLIQQAVGRLFESSAGAFTEMFVRQEHDRLKWRFRDVTALTASLSVIGGVAGAAINASFVEVWTRGRVAWPLLVDVLLGVLLVVTSVSRCFTGFAGVTKEIRLLRFIYFFEGLTFVGLAWFVGRHFGFAGIAAASIAATTLWSGVYGIMRARRQWQCSTFEILAWLKPAGSQLPFLLPLACLLPFVFSGQPSLWRFLSTGASLAIVSAGLLWFLGIPKNLRTEISRRAERKVTPSSL